MKRIFTAIAMMVIATFLVVGSATAQEYSKVAQLGQEGQVMQLNAMGGYTWRHLGGDPLFPGGIQGTTLAEKRADFQLKFGSSRTTRALKLSGLSAQEISLAKGVVRRGEFRSCRLAYGEKLASTSYGSPVRVARKVTFRDERYKATGAMAFCMTLKVRVGRNWKVVTLKVPWKCANVSIKKTSMIPIPDACPAAPGWQFEVPEGYFIEDGICVKIVRSFTVTKTVNRKVIMKLGKAVFVITVTNTGNYPIRVEAVDAVPPLFVTMGWSPGVEFKKGSLFMSTDLVQGASVTYLVTVQALFARPQACNSVKARIPGFTEWQVAKACLRVKKPRKRVPPSPPVSG